MNAEQLQSDLAYVRQTVRSAGPSRSPAAIPLLWAVIIAIGFPLMDFAPRYVGFFWAFAGPGGFLASCALGWWDAKRRGQMSRSEGARWAGHWVALPVAIFLAVALLKTGQVTDKGFGALVLLLLAVVYFLAGVHLEPRMRWISLLTVGGYVLVLFVSGYAWTIIGAALSLSLVLAGIIGGPKRAIAVE